MALGNTGYLGSAEIAAKTTWYSPYAGPASSLFATVSILVVNRDPGNTARVRVAVSTQVATPLTPECMEYDTLVQPNSPLSVTAVVANGQKIWVYSDSINMHALVNGVEDSTT